MALLQPRQLLRRFARSSPLSNLARPTSYRNPMSTAFVFQNHGDSLPNIFTNEVSRSILDFWFADCGSNPTKEQMMHWFTANSEFDEQCRSKFSSLLSKMIVHPSSSITSLATSPERALSLLLLFDQIPRNIFRGDLSSRVYTETDPLAVAVSLHSLSSSLRYDLGPNNTWKTITSKRIWFHMPLIHSEDPALHKIAMEQFVVEILRDCIEETGEPSESAKQFEASTKQHSDVIDMFGRYPYRNKVLGRENTPEEKIWLESPKVGWAR